jgi:predicted nucleotidyltransferase
VARAAALLEVYPEFSSSLSVLSSPNNILGIEYIKALLKRKSHIQPLTITRSGAGYHDKELDSHFSSATAIRQAIEDGVSPLHLSSQIPEQVTSIYDKYFENIKPVFLNDFSGLLYYKLLLEQNMGYSSYMDVSEDLSDRIRKNLYQFTTFSEFCNRLKTKEITYSRICRCLIHILLNIKKNDVYRYDSDMDYVPYARILGFRKNSAPLLGTISKNTDIPLISKLADADKILTETSLEMLKEDIRINDIYNSIRVRKSETAMPNEYSTPIVII